jgi:pimeloyl-ACP methyl ester carboxylesterase
MNEKLDPHTPSSRSLEVLSDAGKGRAFVVLHERDAYREFCERTTEMLSEKTRVINLGVPQVLTHNWRTLTDEVQLWMREVGLRQVSFVSFGAAAAIAENVCLRDLKLVRTLVLVDATSRAHSSGWERFIQRVEASLPLGLPLRRRSDSFDAKPYLQRIRCPALVVTTAEASEHVRSEASQFEQRLPTAWRLDLSLGDQARELATHVLSFEEVPARCPQKNRASSAA